MVCPLKEEFMKNMREVVEIGEVVGNIDELAEGKEKLKQVRKRELTEEEIRYVERFVTGNRYAFIHTKFNQPPEDLSNNQ